MLSKQATMRTSGHTGYIRLNIISIIIIYIILLVPPQWLRHESATKANLHSLVSAEPATPRPSSSNSTTGGGTATNLPPYIATGRKISKILNDFFEKGYDKRVRPNYGGPPVNVNVTMHIISVSSVSEVQMDFTADFYFRQTWADPRLRFIETGDIHTLYVGAEVSKRIWLPDTFFGNEKMAYFHEATTPNVFLRIEHTGEVFRSIRLTVTSSCPMKLQYFPMDRQQCTIEAESYGYNVKDIIYHWAHSKAVERDKTISLPQFDITKIEQKTRIEELSSGTYSRLVAEIHFARRMGYYLIQIYIPSSLIVVISWVSFWLHRNASPARVQLGVTTVLTMTTLMSSTNAALPKISYVKSIDVFLGTCFVMVFAALLEYATVGYLGKRIAMRKAHKQSVLSHATAMIQRMAAAQNQASSNILIPPPPPQTINQNRVAAAAAAANNLGGTNNNNSHHHHILIDSNSSNHHHATTQATTNGPQQQAHNTNTNSGANGLYGGPNKAPYMTQPSVVEQFLNTAATIPNFMSANFDKRGAFPMGSRVVDAKLGKAKQLDSILGVRPSSIDKYSRVVFPVCFVCFQLMYWIVYLHISAFLESDGLDNKR